MNPVGAQAAQDLWYLMGLSLHQEGFCNMEQVQMVHHFSKL